MLPEKTEYATFIISNWLVELADSVPALVNFLF